MHSIFKTLLVLFVVVFQVSARAENRYSYNARIQCPNNTSITNNEYFYAATDMEAKNEVMRVLNNNTSYRDKGCKLIELTSDKPQPKQQQSKSYEVRIQCGSNSSSGSTQYFSADNDLEAENEARRILNNNTSFRGRGCQIMELNSR